MNKRQYKWLVFSLIVLLFYLFFIPISLYNQSPFYWSLSGGIFIFICLFISLGDFTSINEVIESKEKNVNNKWRRWSPYTIAPSMIICFLLYINHSYRKSRVLENEGVIVKGEIMNGDHNLTYRKGETTHLYIIYYKFKDKKDKHRHGSCSISVEEFNNANLGQTVDVIYWEKDPSISKIFFSKKNN